MHAPAEEHGGGRTVLAGWFCAALVKVHGNDLWFFPGRCVWRGQDFKRHFIGGAVDMLRELDVGLAFVVELDAEDGLVVFVQDGIRRIYAEDVARDERYALSCRNTLFPCQNHNRLKGVSPKIPKRQKLDLATYNMRKAVPSRFERRRSTSTRSYVADLRIH